MNNIPTTMDEVIQAMQTLRENGWRLSQSIYGGTNATHPGMQCRKDAQTAADLIELAGKYAPKETPDSKRPQ